MHTNELDEPGLVGKISTSSITSPGETLIRKKTWSWKVCK
jgi:hypothetical protein